MPDPPIDHVAIPSHFVYAFDLGDFAESVTLNLREAIGAIGVDLKAVDDAGFRNQTVFALEAMQKGGDVRMAKHFGRFPRLETDEAWGPFPDGYAVVVGLLEFDAVDRTGNPKRYSIPIRARVFLFNIRYDQPMPPSYQYSAELEPAGENYEVPIKLSQRLKSGDADRFTIRLACSQSATHHFRIRWNFVGGLSSVSYPIDLQQFVPRSFANEEVEQVGAAAFDPELADVPTVFEGDCVEKTLMQMMAMSAAMSSGTQGEG